MRKLVHKPSPALAVAIGALVVALGGTSYAAGLIGSADIKDNSIKSRDVKDQTLQTRDVKNRSLKGKDIEKGTIKTNHIKDGNLRAKDFKKGELSTTRWVLVNANGLIEDQSGGFSVTAGYPALPSPGNGNVYINAHEPLTNNGIVATIALQNTVDLNGDGVTNGRAAGADANPEFSGEIAVSVCGLPYTACAPDGTGNTNHFAVSPRNSDGSFTTDGSRKRFYVVITGDSSDYVAP